MTQTGWSEGGKGDSRVQRTQGLLQIGQMALLTIHRPMQWLWNACPHVPARGGGSGGGSGGEGKAERRGSGHGRSGTECAWGAQGLHAQALSSRDPWRIMGHSPTNVPQQIEQSADRDESFWHSVQSWVFILWQIGQFSIVLL